MSAWGEGSYGAGPYGGKNATYLQKALVWAIVIFITWLLIGLLLFL